MTNNNYFVFKGQKYYIGTIVELGNVAPYPFPYAKHAIFDANSGLFIAMASPTEYYKGHWCMKLTEQNIKCIVKPVGANNIEYVKAYKDTECDDMFYAWITYLAAMFFALFLNGRILALISLTVIFITYRRNKLNVPKSTYEQQKRKGGF